MINFIFLLLPFLSSYNAVDLHIPTKHRVTINATWSEPLPARYYMSMDVVYNTGSGPVTQGYFIVYDAGSSGNVAKGFAIGADWTVASYSVTGWGEYYE